MHPSGKIFLTALLWTSSPALAFTSLAVTVDDIPAAGTESPKDSRAEVQERFLSAFEAEKIPGVYGFLTGILVKDMAARDELVKAWTRAGYAIGNHGFSHLNLGAVDASAFLEDVRRNESILIDYAKSIEELKVFRFPFLHEGDTNEKRYAVRSELARRGYRIAQVTVDFEDWRWNDAYVRCRSAGDEEALLKLKSAYLKIARERLEHSVELARKIWGEREIKHILLIHMNAVTAAYLRDLLREYKRMGIRFIPARNAIHDAFYSEDTTFVGKTGKTFVLQAQETRKVQFRPVPRIPDDMLAALCR